ncbi:MAG: hypothetical protein PHY93_17085, partial [Bacteriovorax sp.]|nr:hypothetical protein [Bacteriovorax sp.]
WQALGVAGSGLTSLGGLTGSTQTFAVGTAGTAPAISSATSTHTLNIPMASTAAVTAGLLSKTDYDAFTAKQAAFTTSAGLLGILSDESGTGFAVFSASPTFTGVPLAPTAAVSTNTTQIATTAFVVGQAATVAPLINGTAAVGTSLLYARQDHVHPTDTTRAPAAGSASVTTLGTITTGTWNGTAIAIANGGTGATTLAGAQTALGLTSAALTATGNLAGNIPLVGTGGIVANNLCAGASSGGGVSCSVANSSAGLAGLITDETGSGLLVFGTSPTILNPVIANIAPVADFTLAQNLVVPFTSVSTGAVANTLYLKAGKVGIGTSNPTLATLQVAGTPSTTSAIFGSSGQGISMITSYPTIGFNSYFAGGFKAIDTGYGGTIGIDELTGGLIFKVADTVTGAGTPQTLIEGMRISNTGNVGIGTTAPNTILDINGAFSQRGMAAPATSVAGQGRIYFDSTSNTFKVSQNNGAYTDLVGAAAPVSSVNTLTGAVVLTTNNIAENTNLYYTNARAIASTITAPTLTNSTIATSDTIQVALGKLQAQFNNVLSLALTGLSTATNSAITAADSILVAFGKLQAQVTSLTSNGANYLVKNGSDTISGTISLTNVITATGAGDIIVNSTPLGMTSAVNKAYADLKLPLTGGTMTGALVNNTSSAGTAVAVTQSGAGYAATFMGGNVGIGTTSPTAKLHVVGQIVSAAYNAGTSAAIDWNNGNNQYTTNGSTTCGAITFTNMLDGGAYTLAVQSVTSGTCTFTHTGLTFVFTPVNAAVTADAVYTFLRVGTKVYVSWLTGFI